ncbi:MAG: hypothetical protein AABW56_00105 [Nanoarchaeota archaeon]|mgnify:CR=1 FL=1
MKKQPDHLLKSPNKSIIKILESGKGLRFLIIGFKEIEEILNSEGMDNPLFPEYDEKYREGIIFLKSIGFNNQILESFEKNYERLLNPVTNEIYKRTEKEKEESLERYRNRRNKKY